MKYLKLSLKIIISLGLVIYLVLNYDFNESWKVILDSDVRYFFLSIFFIILNYIFSAIRWKYLILGQKNISLFYLIKLYFIGSFFNNFLPTSIGGDAYKIYRLGERIKSNSDAFTATFLERFLGMISLIIIAFIAVLSFSQTNLLDRFLVLILISGAFVCFLLFYPKFKFEHKYFNKIFNIIDKIYNSFQRYRNQKLTLLLSFLSSFVVQFFSVASQYTLFLAVFVYLPIAYSFFAFPVTFLSGYAIPSINSIGSQDVLYKEIFKDYALESTILAASILYHFSRFLVSLIGGLFYIIEKKHE